jgi:hypothetical protein
MGLYQLLQAVGTTKPRHSPWGLMQVCLLDLLVCLLEMPPPFTGKRESLLETGCRLLDLPVLFTGNRDFVYGIYRK